MRQPQAAPQSWAVRQDSWNTGQDQEPTATPIAAPVPFWDAVTRNYEDGWETRRRNARYEATDSALWNRHREIERRLGRKLPLAEDMVRQGPRQSQGGIEGWMNEHVLDLDAIINRNVADINAGLAGAPEAVTASEYEAQIATLRRENPGAFEGIPSREQIYTGLDRQFRETRRRADEASGSGAGGMAGGFVGQVAAVFSDPANAGTAVATGGWGATRPLLARMAVQGAVGGTQELLEVGGRGEDAANYGGPQYTAGEALSDVAFGVVGGAGFEALGDGLKVGTRPLRSAVGRWNARPEERGLADALDQLFADEDAIGPRAPDFDAARADLLTGTRPVVEPDRDLEALFADRHAPPEGAVTGGDRRLQRGVLAEGAPSEQGLLSADYQGRQIWSGRFDPLTVEVDAARFQYKADGDADGVTGRLRGVERWDATASGKAILFEETGGRIVVADGHQRRGLARRLAEQGWEDAQLDGYLFREADGWSAREVRVVAALKNVREGSGAIMDAAKLFREAPGALRDRSLPVTGDFIQQARQLANLSDVAFRAVVNGAIPERYGAVLGDLAGDRPEMQGDLVALLQRTRPASADGARALVHEALLDDFIATEGVQLDMFGGLPRQATLEARGKIREAVMAGLKRDQRLFGQLVRNADAIEAGGNALARSENEARLGIDRAAAELVSKLSLRAGDIGEAFQEAARAVTLKELTPGAAAKGLVQRIRAAVKAGEALDEVRAATINPKAPSAAGLAEAQAFDAPGGAGQRAQVEPKPEDVEIEAEAASGGLFDDLPEEGGLERAIKHLRACAPGTGAAA